MYKSYKLKNTQYFEIDNIIIKNDLSYIFNFSDLDKLHQKHEPLKLLIEFEIFVTSTSFTCLNHVRNRTLTSTNLFDIYYFLNKDLLETKLVYRRNMVNFISLHVKKLLKSSMMKDKVLLVNFIHMFTTNNINKAY